MYNEDNNSEILRLLVWLSLSIFVHLGYLGIIAFGIAFKAHNESVSVFFSSGKNIFGAILICLGPFVLHAFSYYYAKFNMGWFAKKSDGWARMKES